jgi:hypothetical protein
VRGSQGGVTELEPATILVTQIEAIKVTHRSTGTITGHKAFTLIAHRGADAIHFLAVQAHIRLAAIAAFKHVNLDARALMIASGLFAAIRHILYGAGYGHHLEYFDTAQGHRRCSAQRSTYQQGETDKNRLDSALHDLPQKLACSMPVPSTLQNIAPLGNQSSQTLESAGMMRGFFRQTEILQAIRVCALLLKTI